MKKRLSAKPSDHLSHWVAAIVTFFALFCFSAHADLDLSLGGFARSFPLSGYAYLQSGYGQVLWGDTSGVLYGYVRPYIELDSAGSYNAALGAVEFFPLSFLGVRAGEEWNQNDSQYHDYDCRLYDCTGTMYRKFVESQLLLGVSDWFASVWLRWEQWTHKSPEALDFIDPNNGLAIHADGDSELVFRFFTGVNVSDQWAAVVGGNYYQMVRHFGIVRFGMVGARFREDSFSVIVGASHYQATEQKGGYGAFAAVTWTPLPSVGLK